MDGPTTDSPRQQVMIVPTELPVGCHVSMIGSDPAVVAAAHLQHVFTAIAVNVERLSSLAPFGEAIPVRPPTAFQDLLDQQGIP